MPGAPLLPSDQHIPPSTECLTNPFRTYDEDRLDRIQSDVPRVCKAYITSLFGRRGAIQNIINTVIYHIEHECRLLGLSGYDPEHDAIVARIVGQLEGASSRVYDSRDQGGLKEGGEPGQFSQSDFSGIKLAADGINALVDELADGPIAGGRSAAVAPFNPSTPDKGREDNAGHDPETSGDADSPAIRKGGAKRGGSGVGKETPRRKGGRSSKNSD